MKYRCPHCGQPAFNWMEKTGCVPWWYIPKCRYCHGEVFCHTWWGGHIGHRWIQFGFACVLFGGFVLSGMLMPKEWYQSFEDGNAWIWCIGLPLLLWAVLAFGYNWLFCYLDKRYPADYISADKFHFITDGAVRLWPRVRVGEIYLIRFPKRKKRDDGPYLIGMVTHVEKDGESQEVTIRVVKEYLMNAPLLEEELVLTTEKGFVLSGTVSHTYRLPSQE